MATLTEGGAPRIDAPPRIDLDALEAGLPLTTINDFLEGSGLQFKDIYDVVIPARTLKHRRARQEPLNLDESDKFARLVRVYQVTLRVFGDKDKALHWLNRPKHRFDERTPIQMLRTEVGGRLVEEMLIQIDEGMFA
ncbi:type II toxin-antitoxin system Xre/ParS family antitoxin [Acidisarcina polymorpha]|uniref:type II RES/Xre toxin-antitoxin system antitoxin n=1 Tax=Acidisarcina polymorpha TaxID=2211140 RepID=UPI00137499AE|nr:antitoxin Xre/MbcA/ParS toxin-binding domain-containing protein [Acidisarcina polymorpha]